MKPLSPTAQAKCPVAVTSFLDYRALLQELWLWKKESTKMSLREVTRELGFASPSHFKMILDGQRKMSAKHLPKLSRVFRLTRFQIRYLHFLIQYQDSTSHEQREAAFGKIRLLQKEHEVPTLHESQYRYFTSWYLVAIREALSGTWAEKPLNELARGLGLHRHQLDDALATLQKLGMIERSGSAQAWKVKDSALQTPREMRHHLIAQFHRQMIHKSLEALDHLPVDQRDMSALTLSIRPTDLPNLKERIAEFREQVNAEFSGIRDASDVIQINIQAFPLLRKEAS